MFWVPKGVVSCYFPGADALFLRLTEIISDTLHVCIKSH